MAILEVNSPAVAVHTYWRVVHKTRPGFGSAIEECRHLGSGGKASKAPSAESCLRSGTASCQHLDAAATDTERLCECKTSY